LNKASGKKGRTMVSRLIKAAIVVAVVAAVIQTLPDVKRYLEIRAM
jgi:hypothetical protein